MSTADPQYHATALAPGTCGELMQGVVGGRDFLITSPIDLFSRVSVELHRGGEVTVAGTLDHSKVKRAVELTLQEVGWSGCGAKCTVRSPIPRSKGLASSSSDITAAIHATAEATGTALEPFTMAKIAVAIEPTDAVFFRDVVMFDHLKGSLYELLGPPPPLSFVLVDTGGEVETLKFDRAKARQNALSHERDLAQGIDLVRRGFREWRSDWVAQGAMVSTRCNQGALPKPKLEALIDATLKAGALGVNCAHSGTVLGVMFDHTKADSEVLQAAAASVMGPGAILGVHRLISGGSRLLFSSNAGLTPVQLERQRELGVPVTRHRVGKHFVLEFEPKHDSPERRFVLPDGATVTSSPDPSEGYWSDDHRDAPSVHELWQMRVRVEADGDIVWYQPLGGRTDVLPNLRFLEKDAFRASFEPEGKEWVRKVRVTALETGHVSIVGLRDGQRRLQIPLPVFLATFTRILDAEGHPRPSAPKYVRHPELKDATPTLPMVVPPEVLSSFGGSMKLRRYLARAKVTAELVNPGKPMPTVPDAAQALNVAPAQVVKSILFQTKKGDEVGLAIVGGDARVAMRKVAASLGLGGLRLAKPEVVLQRTGYEVGGVPPVGHATQLKVVVDQAVLAHPHVFGGGGDEHHMLRITPHDIVRLTGATVGEVIDTGDGGAEER